MPLTQETRGLRLETALGRDRLGLRRFRLRERLGALFEMELEAEGDRLDIEIDKLLGRNLTVALETLREGKPRFFNAFATEVALIPAADGPPGVRITAAPWLWFLTQTRNSRIFQDKTAQEIVTAVLDEAALGTFTFKLKRTLATIKYCVQYNESDFAFISRLLEREGIYYFFTHSNGAHELTFVDAVDSLEPLPGYETYPFSDAVHAAGIEEERIRDWRPRLRVGATLVHLRDYNPDKPAADMLSDATVTGEFGGAGLEVYDWPGAYAERAEGDVRAKLRAEQLSAGHARTDAEGSLRGVAVGARFKLSGHPIDRFNADHFVLEAEHLATGPSYASGDNASESYAVRFAAAPADLIFRPDRVTPWPRIAGHQTAVVVGPSGEEVWPDAHLAVKVQFHWDRLGVKDENSSCWVRTSQGWTGAGWGAMSIPRIGEEVVVAFEDGDPDRPLIVGRVYNGASKPPYDPKDMRTVTTFKTNSSKDGAGFNELRFDDKKGEENVFLHAQKDHDVRVLNDILVDVGNEVHETVAASVFRKIGGSVSEAVAEDVTVKIGGDLDCDIGGSAMVQTGADLHQTVGGEARLSAGGDIGAKAGANHLVESGTAAVVTAGTDFHVKAGANVTIEAGTQLTLKVGGNFVVIGPSGVTIKGATVLINSGGAAGSGPGTKPKAPTAPKAPEVPKKAKTAEAGKANKVVAPTPHQLTAVELDAHPTAAALRAAHEAGAPFCEECQA